MLTSVMADLRDRAKLTAAAWKGKPSMQWEHQALYARRVFPKLLSHVHDGRVTLDIGAHKGVMADYIHRKDPNRRVYMFEADKDKVSKLRSTFSWAYTYPYALTDFDGETSFYVDSTRPGYSGLSGEGTPTRVTARKLDTVMPDIMSVTSMKIDVEGHELSVLRGAELLINRCEPVIMFESGPDDHEYPEHLYEWLDDRRYRIFLPTRVERADELEGLSLVEFMDYHNYPFPSLDYIAVPIGWVPPKSIRT